MLLCEHCAQWKRNRLPPETITVKPFGDFVEVTDQAAVHLARIANTGARSIRPYVRDGCLIEPYM